MNKKYVDMSPEEFRKYGHELIDWIANYFENIESYPALAKINPGDVKSKLPESPPLKPENMKNVFNDIDEIIMPGMTHWNHPKFMAYFNSSGSGPGILAELLSGAFNINGMLWKSSPASTELEEVMMNWLRQMIGLPENFWGIIYDGGSASTLHGIAMAKENIEGADFRLKGMSGRSDTKRLRLYQSEHAHSSVERAAITLGIGIEGVKKIPVNEKFELISSELKKAIEEDRKNGWFPFCVVGTVGTTSSTAIDPIPEISKICKEENLWLHVDAAHAGSAAILPEMKYILNGCEEADSFYFNPHKWMFVPIDVSAFYTKHPDVLRRTFSIVAEYLKTEHDKNAVNHMDYGIQLGRRFRSLKLWFLIRHFGVEGIQNIIREHLRLGKLVEKWVLESEQFELLAPVNFSTICFRIVPGKLQTDEQLNSFNEKLLEKINQTGEFFLTHTKLNGMFTIRIVISGLRTTEKHVQQVWQHILKCYKEIEAF
ncbi:MAG: pyridoxal-dependent decarboxylase [Melioribacteraceae bacterium]|nr:MAG: pyridoxal-dependent decarboxylase [Melioribacteraceae bacterium]